MHVYVHNSRPQLRLWLCALNDSGHNGVQSLWLRIVYVAFHNFKHNCISSRSMKVYIHNSRPQLRPAIYIERLGMQLYPELWSRIVYVAFHNFKTQSRPEPFDACRPTCIKQLQTQSQAVQNTLERTQFTSVSNRSQNPPLKRFSRARNEGDICNHERPNHA